MAFLKEIAVERKKEEIAAQIARIVEESILDGLPVPLFIHSNGRDIVVQPLSKESEELLSLFGSGAVRVNGNLLDI